MAKRAYSAHRFRKALLLFLGGKLAQAAANVLLVLVLVRVLPIADYGAYMLIVGTAEMMRAVASFGIPALAQRYLPQMLTSVSIEKLYGFVAFLISSQLALLGIIVFAIGLAWTALAPVFGMTPEQAEMTRFATWMLLITPAFRFSSDILETMLAQGQINRAVAIFMRAGGVALLVVLKPQVTLADVLVVDMVSNGVCMLFAWYRIRCNLHSLHNSKSDGALPLREMAQFAWHMALVGPMSATASPGAIRLVLAHGLGLAESGLFAFLQSLERLVSRYLPATLLRNLVRPVLISRYTKDGSRDLLKAGTGLLLKSNMLTVIAGLVVIAVCGDQVVLIMSGGKFAGAGLTLLLLYVNMIAASQRSVQEMIMQITGHTRGLWLTTVVSPIALLMVWLFARHGLNVAVLIVCAGSMLANALAAAILHAKTDWFRVDWRGTLAIWLPGLAAAVAGIGISHRTGPLVAGGMALLLFIVFVRVGRPFTCGEIGAVERAVGTRGVRALRLLRGFAV